MQSITNYLDSAFRNTEKLNYLMDMYFTEVFIIGTCTTFYHLFTCKFTYLEWVIFLH